MTQITVALTMSTIETKSILTPYQHQHPMTSWFAKMFLFKYSLLLLIKSSYFPKALMVEDPLRDSERRLSKGDLVMDSILIPSL